MKKLLSLYLRSFLTILLCVSCLITWSQMAPTNGIVYVKPTASGNGDGSDWVHATNNLHQAIHADGVQKVFVAAGTYKVGANSFVMKNGVEIYGGFDPGNGITDLSHDRILPNPVNTQGSVLDGQQIRPVIWNVFTEDAPLNSTAILDGFTLMNGQGASSGSGNGGGGSGAGIRLEHASPVLRNLVVRDNLGVQTIGGGIGGGIYMYSSAPAISNVVFQNNTARRGGGMFIECQFNSCNVPVLTNVLFVRNEAIDRQGGAIYATNDVILNNVTIADNYGSGLHLRDGQWSASATLKNTIVFGGITGHYTAQHSFMEGNVDTHSGNLLATGILPAHIFTSPETGDYTLKSGAPVINSGNNSLYPGLETDSKDLAGNSRVFADGDGTIDLGCYESQYARPAHSNGVVYVKTNVSGNGSGDSWANATDNLRGVIRLEGVEQVWVAAGTYDFKRTEIVFPLTEASRTLGSSLVMKNGVAIYGGFDPENGIVDLNDQRILPDPDNLQGTILNGLNKMPLVWNGFTEPTALDQTAVLDGFTLTGGKSGTDGGGIYNEFASPVLRNLVISGNTANFGGGVFNRNSSPLMIDVVIKNNSVGVNGGGMYNDASATPEMTRVTISGNTAHDGGGIFNRSSSPVMSDMLIYGNTASNDGGGMYSTNSSAPEMSDVTLSANTAPGYGGGMYNSVGSAPVMTRVTLSGNSAGYGGGMINRDSSPILTSSLIVKNTSSNAGGGIYFQNSGNSSLTNVTIADNVPNAISSENSSVSLFNTIVFGAISGSPFQAEYSLIEGNSDLANSNLYAVGMTLDVVFTDPSGSDYRLKETAPAVDAGENSLYTGLDENTKDVAGNPRVHAFSTRGIIDMGAYESVYGDAGSTIYVKPVSAGIGDGSNWANATGDLHGAIHAAEVRKVFVAKGTYNVGDKSFTMKNGVEIYGGFDPDKGITRLTHTRVPPYLEGLPTGSVLNGQGTRTVVLNEFTPGTAIDNSAILDGFVVVGGSSINGGGIRNIHASPTFRNLVIVGNTAVQSGAGIYSESSNPLIISSLIWNNNTVSAGSPVYGGGVCNINSSPVIINSTITRNLAQSGAIEANSHGGGIYNDNSSPQIYNSIIWDNRKFGNASVASADIESYGGTVTLKNSITQLYDSGNPGDNNKVGMDPLFVANGDFRLQFGSSAINAGNHTFLAAYGGIGVRDLAGSPRQIGSNVEMGAYEYSVENSTLYVRTVATGLKNGTNWENAIADLHNAIRADGVEKILVALGTYNVSDNSFVMRNNVAIYGGFDPDNGITELIHNRIMPNASNMQGSILDGQGVRPVIWNDNNGLTNSAILDGFTILNGRNTGGAAGGIFNRFSSPTFHNLVIRDNQSATYGGGVFNQSASPIMVNIVISGNSSDYGGGMANHDDSFPKLMNVTITGNHANYGAGGIRSASRSHPTVHNSIFWGNSSDIEGSITIKNSVTQAFDSGNSADNNLVGVNPQFTDPDNGDYTLLPCSPATNTGSDQLYWDAVNGGEPLQSPDEAGKGVDLSGRPRVFAGQIDLGAYENYNLPVNSGLVQASEEVTRMQSANGETGYFNQCNELLVSVTTTGAEGEVSGRTIARAWVDNIQPTQYVRRHYEIVPAENAEGAEGRVTLYFSQEDFDAFNTVSTTTFLPPLGNVANLLIEKRGGESSDGTGHPNTYPGAVETISDADAVWNEEAQRWEISFDVNGFSGFFVKTTTSPLPVRWISFEGDTEKNRLATLYWKAEETNTNYYEIEKSFDGRSFYGIAQVPAAGHGIATYYFTDPQRLNGMVYYRIRQVDTDGTFSYSSIISLRNPERSVVRAYPNPVRDQLTLETTGQDIGTTFSLVNLLGVEVRKIKLTDEKNVIGLSDLVPGIYLLRRDQNTVLKLIKD